MVYKNLVKPICSEIGVTVANSGENSGVVS
jgi:hypothetical protein